MFATQNSPIRFRQAFGVLLVVASLSCGAAYPPLTGQGATNSQSAYQAQIQQQQIQLQRQLAERRQAVAQQQQDQARQEQARQQQIQLQQQLAERRQAVAQQQQDQARQEQARQQQIQLQQHLAERRQAVAQQQASASTYKDPNNAKIGPATQPSYAAGQDWRGYYAAVPRAVPNQVTGAGSLSTNQSSTIAYDRRREGPDNANPKDAAKTIANYVNTHREETLMNGLSMVAGVGETRLALGGLEVAANAAVRSAARKEATAIAGESVAGATSKQMGGALRNVNPLNGGMNCVNCAVALEHSLRGKYSTALLSEGKYTSELEALYGSKFGPPATITTIENQMAAAGKGSAGIVYGAPSQRDIGHVFVVVNQKGVVRFLDGQTGQLATFNGYSYFQLLRTK